MTTEAPHGRRVNDGRGGFTIRRHAADGTTVVSRSGSADGSGGGNTPVDLGKLRSIGAISRLTKPTVKEGRRPDGVRVKATTDELNTTVTEHARGDRQDVHLRPAPVRGQITKERAAWLMQQHGQSSPSL